MNTIVNAQETNTTILQLPEDTEFLIKRLTVDSIFYNLSLHLNFILSYQGDQDDKCR
jgi:hypothetical protein